MTRELRNRGRARRLGDGLAVVAILMLFIGLVAWKATRPRLLPWIDLIDLEHLGAEYNSIARALADGRGFSDPFREESGPTAWMPPALPYVLAAAHLIGGKQAAVGFMVALNCLAAGGFGWCITREASRLHVPWTGRLLLAAALLANFRTLLGTTHDTGLLLLVYTATWAGAANLLRRRLTAARGGCWGLLGGVAALCSPVAGFAWAAVTLWITGRRPTAEDPVEAGPPTDTPARWRFLLAAAFIALVLVTPWTIRNRVVLGRWLPIKSNGMYELWQSQCGDADGVVDISTFAGHPWVSDDAQRRYAELGEIAFIDEKADEVRQDIYSRPGVFAAKTANRALTAFVLYSPFTASEQRHPLYLGFKTALHALPLLALMAVMILSRPPIDGRLAAAALLWAAGLLPYVVVSYYERYSAPLLTVQSIIVLHGWATVRHRAAILFAHRDPSGGGSDIAAAAAPEASTDDKRAS